MNTNILTKELINFIDDLRAANYNISTTQYVAAQDLILALAAQGNLSPELSGMRTLLAPILCHSSKEQTEFNTHFDKWINQFETVKTAKKPSMLQHELDKTNIGMQLWKWIIIVVTTIGLIVFLLDSVGYNIISPMKKEDNSTLTESK
jgi:uncharacterized protein with von Willebrand factor type A (vWA) domain